MKYLNLIKALDLSTAIALHAQLQLNSCHNFNFFKIANATDRILTITDNKNNNNNTKEQQQHKNAIEIFDWYEVEILMCAYLYASASMHFASYCFTFFFYFYHIFCDFNVYWHCYWLLACYWCCVCFLLLLLLLLFLYWKCYCNHLTYPFTVFVVVCGLCCKFLCIFMIAYWAATSCGVIV